MSNVKENSKFKRFISLFISLILVVSIAAGVDTLAFAAGTYYRPVAKMQTMLRVDNYSPGGVKCTNLGGISAGTANNRLFCIKSIHMKQFQHFIITITSMIQGLRLKIQVKERNQNELFLKTL